MEDNRLYVDFRRHQIDPHPDTVVQCPGYTTGKRSVWICYLTEAWSLLLDSGVGGGSLDEVEFTFMDPCMQFSVKALVLPTFTIDQSATHSRFLLVSLSNDKMSKKTPFAVHKALIGIGNL
ncbi:hypothetical protein TNCV_192611 [Trichonephila clavipes]|nr:hypothetical protein TNCV_192611 [Trichonephila clavipes]